MGDASRSKAMTKPVVKTLAASDKARAIDVLMLAFSADPAVRWTWSDPQQFLANFPRFAKAFGGEAFVQGSAYGVDGLSGAALWLAPGVEPDGETLMTMLQETSSEHSRRDAPAVLEQMNQFHPGEPHWYLPLMGIDPRWQGQGFGSALMKHALVPVDTDGLPAYLESSNPKNVPLYQRHGFDLLGTIQVGSSPPIFPMLRRPRNSN